MSEVDGRSEFPAPEQGSLVDALVICATVAVAGAATFFAVNQCMEKKRRAR